MWGGRRLSNKKALFGEFFFALIHSECHIQGQRRSKDGFEVVAELRNSKATSPGTKNGFGTSVKKRQLITKQEQE